MSHLKRLVRLSEISVPHILRAQNLNENDRHYGGVTEPIKGFADPMTTRGYLDSLLSLYYCSESKYYRDELLLSRCILMMEHLLRWQHDDGTLDFLEVDFASVPTLAFSVQVLVPLVRLIDKCGFGSRQETQLHEKLIAFLKKAAYAMPRGGFNTPNHRWVVASAEAQCGKLLDDQSCIDDCALYLQEGIDCDDEGEFTERSVGIYDAVNDNAMIILREELGRDDLLEFVCRNLDKVQRYMEPDDTVMTLNSTRQDMGRSVYPCNMYWTYRYMACHNKNPRFAFMSERLLSLWERLALPTGNAKQQYEAVGLVGCIKQFLLDESLNNDPPYEPWSDVYHEFYPNAGVVRERQGDCSFSLIKNKPIFLKVQNSRLSLYAKLHASITGFGEGRFVVDSIEQLPGGGYRATHSATLSYARPLANVETCDYNKMPNHLRQQVGHQTLRFTVDVRFLERAVELSINLDGVPDVPWKLELMLDGGGVWETEDSWHQGAPGAWTALKRGEGLYEKDGDIIRISGGLGLQRYAPYARTSEPPNAEKYNIYITGFTPVAHTVRIGCV